MKLLPVVTASAVASLIAAASIVPAHADDLEPVVTFRITASIEVEPDEDTDEPDATETDPAEEEQPDDEVDAETETPTPEQTEPHDVTEQTEAPVEVEAVVPDEPTERVEETPMTESVELFSAVPAEQSPDETASTPRNAAAGETTTPQSRGSATGPTSVSQSSNSTGRAALQDQNAVAQSGPILAEPRAATTAFPTVLDEALEASNSPRLEADGVPAEQGRAQVANEEQRDIPPEPREISTIDPSDTDRDSNSPEPENTQEREDNTTQDEEPQNTEREKQRIESAERPDKDPLPETGATSAALAIGGVLLLAAGVVLVSKRLRVHEAAPRRGRRAKRD